MTADTENKACLSQTEPVCTFRLVNVSNLSVVTNDNYSYRSFENS